MLGFMTGASGRVPVILLASHLILLRQNAGPMDPTQRRWWRLLDELPHRLIAVHQWHSGPLPPREGGGSLHANPTSVVCLVGVVRIRRPDLVIDLHPGEALVIAAGVWHEHEPLRRGSVWFGQGFLPAWSDVVLGDAAASWSGKLPSEPSRRLMDTVLAQTDPARRRQVFAELIRQVLSESVTDLVFAEPALQRMVRRLWNSLHRGVTVADLVRASGLSRAQAYRLFTAGYGVPPKAAIARNRLWLAESLLASGLPIATVAARCGYPSADTFTRAWKRAQGRPPRASLAVRLRKA